MKAAFEGGAHGSDFRFGTRFGEQARQFGQLPVRFGQRRAVHVDQGPHALQAVESKRQRHVDLGAAGPVLRVKQGAHREVGRGLGHGAIIEKTPPRR